MNRPSPAAAPRWVDRFIDRPVLAVVLSLLIVLAGALALGKLPLTEYPNVMPTSVMVRTGYPGANPQVLAQTRERLRVAGACWHELPALWDVDEPADWLRWRATPQGGTA